MVFMGSVASVLRCKKIYFQIKNTFEKQYAPIKK